MYVALFTSFIWVPTPSFQNRADVIAPHLRFLQASLRALHVFLTGHPQLAWLGLPLLLRPRGRHGLGRFSELQPYDYNELRCPGDP